MALFWLLVVAGLWWVLLPASPGLGPALPALAPGGGPATPQTKPLGEGLLREVLRQTIPGLRALDPQSSWLEPEQLSPSHLLRRFMEAGGGLALNQPWTLLAAELPVLRVVEGPAPGLLAAAAELPLIPLAQGGRANAADGAPTGPVAAGPASWQPPKGEAVVFIYHTHATEGFLGPITAGSGVNPDIHGFTPDTEQNMVRVGHELRKVLEEQYGLGVVHVPDLFDWQNGSVTRIGAYYRSLQVLENFQGSGQPVTEVYPNLVLMIDLHRDAVPRAASLVTIGRQEAARVLFIVGTRSQDHPNWPQNLCVANALNNLLEESYPGVSRGVRRRSERFNQHLLPGALLIEIGSVENTLAEALATARILGHVINAAGERGLLPQPGTAYECPADSPAF